MKIQTLKLHPYQIPLTTGQIRSGALIEINSAWGDIAPLPKWSEETLEEAVKQLQQKKRDVLQIDWAEENCFQELSNLKLLPSVTFGLESALLSLLAPLPDNLAVPASALFMGTFDEILKQADLRGAEGFTSAKLKVNNHSFDDAARLIYLLKDRFHLRIDVNRAWSTADALCFFAQFPKSAFDYVEEPFQNPHDLHLFSHPLAVDESFPRDLSLKDLARLPQLKALIYKPTLQGGMTNCLPLHQWASKLGISIVLSSSFESEIGLVHIAQMAQRLSLTSPIGIGTYHYLKHPR